MVKYEFYWRFCYRDNFDIIIGRFKFNNKVNNDLKMSLEMILELAIIFIGIRTKCQRKNVTELKLKNSLARIIAMVYSDL